MSHRDTSDGETRAAMDAYRAAACAEADAYFDDRALDVQRQKILARLAHAGNPARVIPFPKATAPERPSTGLNRRWISVAAAAGLIIGLLTGQLVHLMPQGASARRTGAPVVGALPASPAGGPTFVQASAPADDFLLNEIELATEIRAANELRVLDEFTPLIESK